MRLGMLRLSLLYAAFAALAIAVNIGTQMLCMRFYAGTGAIAVSMVAGTATGLVAKYLLDKRWIFAYQVSGPLHEARTFVLYTAMGVLTTLVFWGTEFAFERAFATDAMRYLGGVLGLVVGYVCKYLLDRRFVFR